MKPAYNVFFDLTADEPALTIAPCISITLTPEIIAEDAAKLAARTVRITWTPRLSMTKVRPTLKTHAPSKDPRKRGAKVKAPAKAGRKRMPEAEKRKRHRASQAKRDKERRDAGQCIKCGSPNVGKISRCAECVAHQRGLNREYYERKVRRGEA